MDAQKALGSSWRLLPSMPRLPRQHSIHTPRPCRSQLPVFRATEEEKKSSEKEEENPFDKISKDTQTLSAGDIRELMRYRKNRLQEEQSRNFVQDVQEEAKLIVWPTPVQAVVQSSYVILLVTITAAGLFALNSGLSRVFDAFYKMFG